ncbi:MAG: T9SS type A sorting domain-containing protein, partial [Candidatus Latescibacterota bacterium]
SSEPIKNEDLNWHTSIENVMIQENSGVWVSKQQGVIQIYSDFQGFLSDTLLIRVLPPKMVRLDVSIEDSLLLIGKTYGLRVEGVISESEKTVLQDGYQIALSDSGIARVVNGEIQALSFGSCEVTVWQGDLLGRVNVQVVAYGDLNADGEHTIWDAVRVVHLILGIEPQATDFEKQSADFNQDGVLDIRDLIGVIQRMFQGEIVSNKLAENRSNIGVRKRIGGVSLNIPSQTIAITFKTKSNQNKSIKASSGHIFWVQDDMGGKGIILPGEEMGVVWQSQTVEVFGASALEAFEWMAWKLDGSSYLLLSQDESGGGVKILGSHPNPLNPSTTIDYRISAPQAITINVYNITGQWICELYDGYMPNGLHKTTWNGYDAEGRVVASGLYFVQLKGALNVSTLKMVVLR